MSADEEAQPSPVYMVSIHPVSDYSRWKSVVDRREDRLARLGVTRRWIFRASDDPNEVMIVFQLPSVEHAERLLKAPDVDIPGWMERSGLEIYPTFFVGEQTDVREFPEMPMDS